MKSTIIAGIFTGVFVLVFIIFLAIFARKEKDTEDYIPEISEIKIHPDTLYKCALFYFEMKNLDSLLYYGNKLYLSYPSSRQYARCDSLYTLLKNTIKNEKEKEAKLLRKKALKNLRVEYDKIDDVYWCYNKQFTHSVNSNRTCIYMSIIQNRPYLHLVMSYSGEDWIFFDKASLFSGYKLDIPFKDSDKKTEVLSGGVYEWIDVPVDAFISGMLSQALAGEEITMRLSGKYQKTRKLSKAEINGISDVYSAYLNLLGIEDDLNKRR